MYVGSSLMHIAQRNLTANVLWMTAVQSTLDRQFAEKNGPRERPVCARWRILAAVILVGGNTAAAHSFSRAEGEAGFK